MTTDAFPYVLLLGGRAGVGKSTVGAALSDVLRADGVDHAHLEGDALDSYFTSSSTDPGVTEMTERNLAAIWSNYAGIGVRRLVYVNTVSVLEPDMITRALGGRASITSVLLTADDDSIRDRLGRREHGAALDAHLIRSARAAVVLDRDASDRVRRVSTTGRSVDAIAREVRGIWADADVGARVGSSVRP